MTIVSNTDRPNDDYYPTLSIAERDRRWARVRTMMSEEGVDVLVVVGWGHFRNDAYLTNEPLHAVVVFTPTDDPFVLVGDVPLNRYDGAGARYERWTDQWKHGDPVGNMIDALTERGLADKTVGVVGLTGRMLGEGAGVIPFAVWSRILAQLPQATFVDLSHTYETLTLVKSVEEQEMIRKAAAIVEVACHAFLDSVHEGVPESLPPAAAVHAVMAAGGFPRAPHILARAGEKRFGWGTPEWFDMGGRPPALRRGDSISAELFAHYGGFEAQAQMDVVVGEPDALLRELEAVCLESYEAGLAAIRPGLRFAVLADIMDEPLRRSRTWNTGPMIQTVPIMFNSKTRINPEVDPALSHLPALPRGVERDGDFSLEEGVAFSIQPNAIRDGKRVSIGGTIMLTARGLEVLNELPNRLLAV